MKELWKPVAEYEDRFEISSLGRLRNTKGKILSQTESEFGYLGHSTRIGGRSGKCVLLRIHRLVAEAFIDNPENKPFVNHIDFNKKNNSFENLEWVTTQENNEHSAKAGRFQKKLTLEDVEYIKNNYSSRHKEFGCNALAEKFNVSTRMIRYVKMERLSEFRPSGCSLEN